MPGYNWFKSKLELKVENIDCLSTEKTAVYESRLFSDWLRE